VIESSGGRLFATHPAAVVVPIVNEREALLLLESPRRTGWWEPVNGAVDAGETLLEAALREAREEVGPTLRVRPLGVVHASTFAYDARLRYVISVTYLMAHERGDPVPGDDMRGSRVRWASLDEIASQALRIVPPLDQPWLRQRTVELFRLWKPAPDVPLQGPLTDTGWNKADHAG
jgi:8-oxo-dGTP diphosphatase